MLKKYILKITTLNIFFLNKKKKNEKKRNKYSIINQCAQFTQKRYLIIEKNSKL